MSKGTVLVAVSAADHLIMASGKSCKTGTYLNELLVPLMALIGAGWPYAAIG